ncbi:DUF1963 domain-containing protein [Bradyrhizobium sp. JYMT SZCCT0428]|uniref:DUF1963 domain-containing protein n=1 Tax=Bradyrhizobium sp. JYMT SZCCT0428 TaxID=2807673 RepID=UPI001BA917FD|nr:DUF1963 domain-containing protein [Bradyrhizobium sp. JYMT SZCCT0428]MBR1149114.1 hypothetical protein [Bradyrhizobium sp. JYMT SZCCT0428]
MLFGVPQLTALRIAGDLAEPADMVELEYFAALLAWRQRLHDPASLHPALRELMERIWLHETLGHHGAMGHGPAGHIYTPHGPETDTEVLLELPTSSMQGWIWGDVYSIVLLIKRKALSQGNFADIAIDITN